MKGRSFGIKRFALLVFHELSWKVKFQVLRAVMYSYSLSLCRCNNASLHNFKLIFNLFLAKSFHNFEISCLPTFLEAQHTRPFIIDFPLNEILNELKAADSPKILV